MAVQDADYMSVHVCIRAPILADSHGHRPRNWLTCVKANV
jgi:hypothetical protein